MWQHRGKILTGLSVILTIADVVSDIIMAFDYWDKEEVLWFSLTWVFIILPILSFPVVVPATKLLCLQMSDRNVQGAVTLWTTWKATELALESGPQLLLQLYIMALPDQDVSMPGLCYYFSLSAAQFISVCIVVLLPRSCSVLFCQT